MGWEWGRGRGRGLLAWRLISSSLWYNTGGGGGGVVGIFGGGAKLWFKRDCWTFFVANYFSQRGPRVSQSVNVNSQLGTQTQFF